MGAIISVCVLPVLGRLKLGAQWTQLGRNYWSSPGWSDHPNTSQETTSGSRDHLHAKLDRIISWDLNMWWSIFRFMMYGRAQPWTGHLHSGQTTEIYSIWVSHTNSPVVKCTLNFCSFFSFFRWLKSCDEGLNLNVNTYSYVIFTLWQMDIAIKLWWRP